MLLPNCSPGYSIKYMMNGLTLLPPLLLCSIIGIAFAGLHNNRCEYATPIFLDAVYDVDLSNATLEFPDSYMTGCVVPYETELKWYKIIGNGNRLKATTCHSGTKGDTRIWVFEDGVCHTSLNPQTMHPKCIDGNDDDLTGCSSNPFASSSVWNSQKNKVYYIAVGDVEHEPFQVSIDSIGHPTYPAPNDKCSNAKPIEIGKEVIIDTRSATIDRSAKIGACAASMYEKVWRAPFSGAGLWYTFLGNGTQVAIHSLWTYERPDKAWYWTRVWEWRNSTCNVLDGKSTEGAAVSEEPLCVPHADSFFAEKGVVYIVMVDGQLGIRNKDFSMILVQYPEQCDEESITHISEEVNQMLAA